MFFLLCDIIVKNFGLNFLDIVIGILFLGVKLFFVYKFLFCVKEKILFLVLLLLLLVNCFVWLCFILFIKCVFIF